MQNWRKDGMRGLQRGLSVGITREIFFNGIRIGLYVPVLDQIHTLSQGHECGKHRTSSSATSRSERLTAGIICGALGGFFVNPIEIVKIRLQSQG